MRLKRTVLLLFLCSIYLFFYGQAYSESLDITVTPDKSSYTGSEIAYLTIRIANNTERAAFNIQIKNILPEGLVYVAPAEAEKVIGAIQPGQEAKHVVRLRKPNLPQTGDRSTPALWGLLMLATAGLVIWHMKRRLSFGENR